MSEELPLSFVLASNPSSVPVLPFLASYDGHVYTARELFGKTVLLQDKTGYRVTLRQETVRVDPDRIQWEPRNGSAPPPPTLAVVPDETPAPRNDVARREEKEEMGIDSTPRTCRHCEKTKPAKEFDRAGIYGAYCHECKPLVKAARAAGPAGKVKVAAQVVAPPELLHTIDPPTKRAYKKRKKGKHAQGLPIKRSIVAKASRIKASAHKNGTPAPRTLKELIGDLKTHLAVLKAECEQLRTEKAELTAQLEELVATA